MTPDEAAIADAYDQMDMLLWHHIKSTLRGSRLRKAEVNGIIGDLEDIATIFNDQPLKFVAHTLLSLNLGLNAGEVTPEVATHCVDILRETFGDMKDKVPILVWRFASGE